MAANVSVGAAQRQLKRRRTWKRKFEKFKNGDLVTRQRHARPSHVFNFNAAFVFFIFHAIGGVVDGVVNLIELEAPAARSEPKICSKMAQICLNVD